MRCLAAVASCLRVTSITRVKGRSCGGARQVRERREEPVVVVDRPDLGSISWHRPARLTGRNDTVVVTGRDDAARVRRRALAVTERRRTRFAASLIMLGCAPGFARGSMVLRGTPRFRCSSLLH